MMDDKAPKLTGKQRRFADLWLGSCGFNGTEAANQAGYKTTKRKTLAVIASENLRKPNIRAYIRYRLTEDAMGEEELVRRISDIARGNLLDYVDDQGRFDIEIAKTSGKGHVLKKMKVTVDAKAQTISYEMALHDPQRALHLLAQAHELTKGGALPDKPLELEKDLGDLLDLAYGENENGEGPKLLEATNGGPAIETEAREVKEDE